MSLAKALRSKSIMRIDSGRKLSPDTDMLAVEEPLEIRVGGRSVAVVMRTPGHDRELAAGFLVTEGLIRQRDDLLDIVRCTARGDTDIDVSASERESPAGMPVSPRRGTDIPVCVHGIGQTPDTDIDVSASERESPAGMPVARPTGESAENVLDVLLAPTARVDLSQLTRHVFTSSSCGICSKASIEAVKAQLPPLAEPLTPSRSVLVTLPQRLAAAQLAFAATGGLHASALFNGDGTLELAREDVGRHNALDKVIGWAFFAEQLPLTGRILLVSGRVSFELMQKALAGGIACVAAISAPTTAAVEFAEANGQTLVGFLRGERMNVYAGTLTD